MWESCLQFQKPYKRPERTHSILFTFAYCHIRKTIFSIFSFLGFLLQEHFASCTENKYYPVVFFFPDHNRSLLELIGVPRLPCFSLYLSYLPTDRRVSLVCSGFFFCFCTHLSMLLGHYVVEYMFKGTTFVCFLLRVKTVVTSHPTLNFVIYLTYFFH